MIDKLKRTNSVLDNNRDFLFVFKMYVPVQARLLGLCSELYVN